MGHGGMPRILRLPDLSAIKLYSATLTPPGPLAYLARAAQSNPRRVRTVVRTENRRDGGLRLRLKRHGRDGTISRRYLSSRRSFGRAVRTMKIIGPDLLSTAKVPSEAQKVSSLPLSQALGRYLRRPAGRDVEARSWDQPLGGADGSKTTSATCSCSCSCRSARARSARR